jgi:hypothetical protein
VYFIKNRITGQFYHGSRASNVRLKRHPTDDLWVHYFTSSAQVKKLIEQYGKDSFDVEIIFVHTDYKVCFWEEQKLIKNSKKDPLRLNKGYIDPDTSKRCLTTYGESEESKIARIKKMQQTKKGKFNSNGHLGLKNSEETKERMRQAQQKLGYTHSEEAKQKMRKPKSAEHKQKLSLPKTKETKDRMQLAQQSVRSGDIATNEWRRKQSESKKGKPWTESRRLAQLNRKGKQDGNSSI